MQKSIKIVRIVMGRFKNYIINNKNYIKKLYNYTMRLRGFLKVLNYISVERNNY